MNIDTEFLFPRLLARSRRPIWVRPLLTLFPLLGCFWAMTSSNSSSAADSIEPIYGEERQVTHGPGGRILTNIGCWSPDSQWLLNDVRSDPAGDIFDGSRIEAVNVETGEIRLLYQSTNGAQCGVATHHPKLPLIVFILGPEHPTDDWNYGPNHRQGVVVDTRRPGEYTRLDARDLVSPPTPGALRGGTHVHVWDGAGEWLSFTYNDAIAEPGLRDIGVSIPGHAVHVKPGHARNHDADWFSALVTRTVPEPRPGSDEYKKANEEGWIGTNGYVRDDGTRQRRAITFQGLVVGDDGKDVTEVFVADLPDELTEQARTRASLNSAGLLEPLPGATFRRLTRTTSRKYPGIQGTRHWLRCASDGSQIACFMRDDTGVSQIWLVSPATGELKQLTHNSTDISTAISWSSNGEWIAHGLAGRVCLTNVKTGKTHPVVGRSEDLSKSPEQANPIAAAAGELRKEACVISPDGSKIAFVRSKSDSSGSTNQICVIKLENRLPGVDR